MKNDTSGNMDFGDLLYQRPFKNFSNAVICLMVLAGLTVTIVEMSIFWHFPARVVIFVPVAI